MNIKFSIGDVPVSIDSSFSWDFTPGTKYYTTSIRVPFVAKASGSTTGGGEVVTRFNKFWPPQNPTTIKLDDGDTAIEIKNVYVLSYKIISNGGYKYADIQLADRRWQWAPIYGKVAGRFNMLRRVNDSNIVENGEKVEVPGQKDDAAIYAGTAPLLPQTRSVGGGLSIVGFSPKDVTSTYSQTPKYQYREWSLNTVPQPFGRDPKKEPWTAYKLFIHLLTELVGDVSQIVLDEGVIDNQFPIIRYDIMGTPYVDILNDLSFKARVDMYIGADGLIHIFSLDIDREDAFPDFPPRENFDCLYYPQKHIIRPSKTRVYFQVENEHLFYENQEKQSTSIAGTPEIVNVCPLPRKTEIDLSDGKGPRELTAGTYVPINAWMDKIGVSEYWLQEYWHSPDITSVYATLVLQIDPPTMSNAQREDIAVLKSHYRSTYQLNDYYRENAIAVAAHTCTQIDVISGKRQPSPVWVYYSLCRAARIGVNRDIIQNNDMFTNIMYDSMAGTGRPQTDAEPGPFTLQTIDSELGIFKITAGRDLSGVGTRFEISNIDPAYVPKITFDNNTVNLTLLKIARQHSVAFILTIMMATPNNKGSLYMEEIKNEDIGEPEGSGPIAEVFVSQETARFDMKDIVSGSSATANFVNEGMVKARAKAEAKANMAIFRDRLTGTVLYDGLHYIAPFGQVTESRLILSGGRFSTRVSLDGQSRSPNFEQIMVQDGGLELLKVLHKIPGGGQI